MRSPCSLYSPRPCWSPSRSDFTNTRRCTLPGHPRPGGAQHQTARRGRSNLQREKVVIITGGSSGIGRAAALRFAEQGYKVLITGRRSRPIEETMSEHANIAGTMADTASAEDARRTIAKAVDSWGRIDALVNNAGAGAILPLADTTADRITDIFSVNVFGPSLLASA